MPRQRRVITLTKTERGALERFVARGRRSARAIMRARSLLLSDEGRKERELTEILGVSRGTVYNVRKRYQQKAYEHILDLLQEALRSGRPIAFDSRVEAQVTMIACSAPPAGRGRWTLRLMADKLVKLEITDAISHESVRRLLKKPSQAVAERTVVHWGHYGPAGVFEQLWNSFHNCSLAPGGPIKGSRSGNVALHGTFGLENAVDRGQMLAATFTSSFYFSLLVHETAHQRKEWKGDRDEDLGSCSVAQCPRPRSCG